jgi:DNA-binding transcriptional regulator YdaS (Cro superfamily)
MSHDAFKRALAHFGDKQTDMAKAIGTSQQRISYILAKENACPADLAPAVSRATGIPLHELRPDVFKRPRSTKVAQVAA